MYARRLCSWEGIVRAKASRLERRAPSSATSYSCLTRRPWRHRPPPRSSQGGSVVLARRTALCGFQPPSGLPQALARACERLGTSQRRCARSACVDEPYAAPSAQVSYRPRRDQTGGARFRPHAFDAACPLLCCSRRLLAAPGLLDLLVGARVHRDHRGEGQGGQGPPRRRGSGSPSACCPLTTGRRCYRSRLPPRPWHPHHQGYSPSTSHPTASAALPGRTRWRGPLTSSAASALSRRMPKSEHAERHLASCVHLVTRGVLNAEATL